tara:strand:+ start:137 stop:349 length:213 start_codon:yes stop_codon:yes gene_type:complete
MNKNELLYEALLKHYEGKKASAKATLAVYFDNAAGIGEHPQVVEEMTKQVEEMANAEDCIESIKRNLDVF